MRDSYEGLGYAGRLSDKNNSALAHILARGTHGAHDDIKATSHKLMLGDFYAVGLEWKVLSSGPLELDSKYALTTMRTGDEMVVVTVLMLFYVLCAGCDGSGQCCWLCELFGEGMFGNRCRF